MTQTADQLVAKARKLSLDELSEIVGKEVNRIIVSQIYHDTVAIEIHLGEQTNCKNGLTFPLLKYLSEQLDTVRLDLYDRQFSEGCDTCEHGSDNGWDIWCRL